VLEFSSEHPSNVTASTPIMRNLYCIFINTTSIIELYFTYISFMGLQNHQIINNFLIKTAQRLPISKNILVFSQKNLPEEISSEKPQSY